MKATAQTNIVPFTADITPAENGSNPAPRRRRPRSRRRGIAHPGTPSADSRRSPRNPVTPHESPEARLSRILAEGFWRHDGSPNG